MIKEYQIEPYPRRLWVTNASDLEEVRKEYSFICEVTDEQVESSASLVIPAKNKDNYYGYFVIINEDCESRHLVHEAIHIALDVYRDCDCSINEEMDQEPFAYLVESIYNKLKQ